MDLPFYHIFRYFSSYVNNMTVKFYNLRKNLECRGRQFIYLSSCRGISMPCRTCFYKKHKDRSDDTAYGPDAKKHM